MIDLATENECHRVAACRSAYRSRRTAPSCSTSTPRTLWSVRSVEFVRALAARLKRGSGLRGRARGMRPRPHGARQEEQVERGDVLLALRGGPHEDWPPPSRPARAPGLPDGHPWRRPPRAGPPPRLGSCGVLERNARSPQDLTKRGRRLACQSVLISPPSMTKSAPVILPERSLARNSTRSATSLGRVNRPVAKPPCDATTCRFAVSKSTPEFFATVAATPSGPSQSAVSTGPGLTVFTRMPLGPSPWTTLWRNSSVRPWLHSSR